MAPLPGAMAKDEQHLGTAAEPPPWRDSYEAWLAARHGSAPRPTQPRGSQAPWLKASHASALRQTPPLPPIHGAPQLGAMAKDEPCLSTAAEPQPVAPARSHGARGAMPRHCDTPSPQWRPCQEPLPKTSTTSALRPSHPMARQLRGMANGEPWLGAAAEPPQGEPGAMAKGEPCLGTAAEPHPLPPSHPPMSRPS